MVAVVGGELVLVEEVEGFLVDRASGRVLDPAEILLVGVDSGWSLASAVA